MDPTTKEGREALLTELLAEMPVDEDGEPNGRLGLMLHSATDVIARQGSRIEKLESEQERLYAVVWAADRLGVAVQKWTDYRDRYGSGDGIQELRVKDTLAKYWAVTGGSPETRGLNAANTTPEAERDAIAERDELRADLERAREGLRLAAAQMAGMAIALRNLAPGDPCKTADQMDAWAREAERSALSPSPAPVETPPDPYEPSDAEIVAACGAFARVAQDETRGSSIIYAPAIRAALIAAHNARSSEP